MSRIGCAHLVLTGRLFLHRACLMSPLQQTALTGLFQTGVSPVASLYNGRCVAREMLHPTSRCFLQTAHPSPRGKVPLQTKLTSIDKFSDFTPGRVSVVTGVAVSADCIGRTASCVHTLAVDVGSIFGQLTHHCGKNEEVEPRILGREHRSTTTSRHGTPHVTPANSHTST